jgi:glutathione-specific gamma-glutamylcyclotransferase
MPPFSTSPPADATPAHQNGHEDLWVFGYGSLMWKPGFVFEERVPARLFGAHRALCVYSFHHRGTPECPGLVMGLDRGGSCHGMAFRVAAAQAEETRAYLTAREQINYVYRDVMHPLRLADGRKVHALTYLMDQKSAQYAGRLDHATILRFIRQGHGESGACTDYVLNTIEALAGLGIHDHGLDWLKSALQDEGGEMGEGSGT